MKARYLFRFRLLLLLLFALGLTFYPMPGRALTCPIWACTDYVDSCPNTTQCLTRFTYIGQCSEWGYTYNVYQATCGTCFPSLECSVGAW